MATLQELMSNAIATASPTAGIPVVPTKQQEVAQASQQKKAELAPPVDYYQAAAGMGNQHGAMTMNPVEQDLRTMNRYQLIQKYGHEQAQQMLGQLVNASNQFRQDRTVDRNNGDLIYDTSTGAISGAINSLGGIAAWGLGQANDNAGAWASQKLTDATNSIEESQSDGLNRARRAHRTVSGLDSRDSTALYEQEVADGSSEFAAGLRRIGRDVVDGLSNATEDGTVFAQGTADAAGSLLAGGVVAKGLKAAALLPLGGAAAVEAAAATKGLQALAGVGNASNKATNILRANSAINFGAWPTATALMEGGGAYAGTTAEVMGMKTEDLYKNSEDFRTLVPELMNQGMSQEEAEYAAKVELATDAGDTAFNIAAPIGGVTGLLSRWAENPLKVPSLRAGVTNVALKEPGEELLQSGSGQFAQNYGIQQNADATRTLSTGVGQAAAEGAIYGAGSAATFQGPGMAVEAIKETGKLLWKGTKALGGSLVSRGKAIEAGIEAQSTISVEQMKEMTQVIVANGPQAVEELSAKIDEMDAEPEAKEEAKMFVSALAQSFQFDPTQDAVLNMEGFPEAIREQYVGVTDRNDAIFKSLDLYGETEDPDTKMAVAAVIYSQLAALKEANSLTPDLIEAMDDKSSEKQTILQLKLLTNHMQNQQQLQAVLTDLESKFQAGVIGTTPITDAEMATPEGKLQALGTAELAINNPGDGDAKVIEGIMKHAGTLQLTPTQYQLLDASRQLIYARQEFEKATKGLKSARDVVTSEIITGTDGNTKGPSAKEFMVRIRDAMVAKDLILAKKLLSDFGLFVEHQTNKANATNEHLGGTGGAGVSYRALNATTRKWFDTKKPAYVNFSKSGSVDLGKAVFAEQNVLANIYNGISRAFPELEGGDKEVIEPNQILFTKRKSQPAATPADTTPAASTPVAPTQTAPVAPEAAPVVTPPPVSRISEAQASLLSTAGLDTRIKIITDRMAEEPDDGATLEVLNNERIKRESLNAAGQSLSPKGKDKPVAPDETDPITLGSSTTTPAPAPAPVVVPTAPAEAPPVTTPTPPAAAVTTPTAPVTPMSKTPEFDKLPSFVPGQKTMVYAGIGSRQTTPEALAQMKIIAAGLAQLGYTLRSGGAEGADKAFESGAEKKEIFYAKDATATTRTIAKEIHPAPGALGKFPLDLMARNTNQIFGESLDSPVDFVLAYTPDGIESSKERTIKSGGTGQAIDMASRKGIPVINMAKAGWETRLLEALGLTAEQATFLKVPGAVTQVTPTVTTPAQAEPALKGNRVAEAGGQVMPVDEVAMEGDSSNSPWLMADGSIVGTSQDHIGFAEEYSGARTYSEFMNETGAVRAAFFNDASGKYVVSLHLAKGQSLTAAQMATLRQIESKRGTPITVLFGRADGLVNPKYEVTDLAGLEVETTQVVTTETVVEESEASPSSKIATYRNTNNSSLRTLFPNLVQFVRNMFYEAFTKPESKKPLSQLQGKESPAEFMLEALSSQDSLDNNLQVRDSKHRLDLDTIAGYATLLGKPENANKILESENPTDEQVRSMRSVGGLLASLDRSLQGFLNKSRRKDGGTNQEAWEAGEEINRWVNGKALNIVEKIGDGYAYNQNLIESAALAAMSWFIGADDLIDPAMDKEAAATYLGVDESEVTDSALNYLSRGYSQEEMKTAIANKIKQYWGVKANKDMEKAYTDGIPEAIAAELMTAMVDLGMVKLLDKTDVDLPGKKDINRLIVDPKITEPVKKYRSAIDEVVSDEGERKFYLDGQRPKIPETQMGNKVPLTREQKEVIKREIETPFFFNNHMLNLIFALGESGVRNLFAAGELEHRKLNRNHRESLEGQNINMTSAFKTLFDMYEQMADISDREGIPLNEVAVRFGYNFSSVNRMQMLGGYNPQASKLLREVLLPTWSTLDLSSNSEHIKGFELSMAQALGIKVHKLGPKKSSLELDTKLKGEFAPLIKYMTTWMDENDTSTDPGGKNMTMLDADHLANLFSKTSLEKASPLAIHALTEHIRYTRAEATERAAFKTALYLEADGVTNGPFNALNIFTIGNFKEQWVRMVKKGGMAFGGAKALHELDTGPDTYETVTSATSDQIRGMQGMMAAQGNAAELKQMTTAVYSLLDMLVEGVTYHEDEVGLTRSVTKNPLTVFLYGSSAKGIADKITGQLLDALYAKFSDVAERKAADSSLSDAEAFFPDDTPEDAHAKMVAFSNHLNHVRNYQMVFSSYNQEWSIDESEFQPTKGGNWETRTLRGDEIGAIRQNIMTAFINPMVTAIEKTVGYELVESLGDIKTATQAQSTILEQMFKVRINQFIEKKKSTPGYTEGDFLSENDLAELEESLKDLAPFVQTGKQNFNIVKTKNAFSNGYRYSRAFSSKMEFATPANYKAPMNSGVAGIPFLVIGSGDGMMMQIASLVQGMVGTLKIFDGMNMPADKVVDYSRDVNKAAYEATMGNPIRALQKTYENFLKNFSDTRELLEEEAMIITGTSPEDSIKNLMKWLKEKEDFSYLKIAGVFSNVGISFVPVMNPVTDKPVKGKYTLAIDPQALFNAIENLAVKLKDNADQIDARHAALKRMGISFDQMASAAAPHFTGTDTNAADMSDPDVANELNQYYEEELAKIKAKDTEPKPVTAPTTATNAGIAVIGNLRRIDYAALKRGSRINLDANQQIMYDQIMRSGALEGYQIITGTLEDIQKYQRDNGLQVMDSDAGINGMTSTVEKVIYLVNPSNEVIVHELIHAATLQLILAKYTGQDLGPNAQEITEAIDRLEVLMQEFLSAEDLTNLNSPEINHARAVIQQELMDMGNPQVAKARALNEFMAWALTNPEIASALKNKKVPALVKLAKDVIAAIKQMFFGKTKAPKLDDSFLSNLQFNTAVLIRAQPTLGQMIADAGVYHRSVNGPTDIQKVREALQKKVVDHLDNIKVNQKTKIIPEELRPESMLAAQMSLTASTLFTMNQEEQSTFRMVTMALATQARIDPNVLGRAQELFTQVSKKLTVESFIPEGTVDVEAARYDANEKFNFVMGKFGQMKDKQGRTTMLSTFLGLAMTNPEFRKILSNIKTPKTVKDPSKTLDALLDNFGHSLIDKLGEVLTKDTKSQNVMEAVDNLSAMLYKNAFEEKTAIEEFATKGGTVLDKVNDKVVEHLQFYADKGEALSERLAKGNKAQQLAGAGVLAISALASEKVGERAAEGIISLLNKGNMPKAINDLIIDFMGRLESNAPIYDMIKRVRSQIQQIRQQFRDNVPRIIAEKFTRKLDDKEWASMFRVFGKTDIAVLLDGKSSTEVLSLIGNTASRNAEIAALEDQIQVTDKHHWALYQTKMKQLAHYMMTGETGVNLLRNANAIGNLLLEVRTKGWKAPDAKTIQLMDKLTTLYALNEAEASDLSAVVSLVQSQKTGTQFVLDYLQGQRRDELNKANRGHAKFNHYKGYIPSTPQGGLSLKVASETEFTNLSLQGYTRLGGYRSNSRNFGDQTLSYYFTNASGKAAVSQGILQNIKHTASGVDETYGFSTGLTGGRITDPTTVQRMVRTLRFDTNTVENYVPVFDELGQVFAFERSLDPKMLAKLNNSENLAQMLGTWRGRQVEEKLSQEVNRSLIQRSHTMYTKELKKGKKDEYINLMASKDKVNQDMVNLFSAETREYIESLFGEDQFWVRKDLVEDIIGYRNASVGDLFTGNTRWSPETQKLLRNVVLGVFGPDAYRKLIKAEQLAQGVFADVRTLIVVKSVVVPVFNMMSNTIQLMARGVPIAAIARGVPAKVKEIHSYAISRVRQIELEAELRAVEGDVLKERRIRTELKSIEDSHSRMSIWPLIQAGEFSTVADAGMTADDLELTSGNASQWIERKIDQLPGSLKTAARYGYISRDTSLFQGLQKMVQYGDFVAKAVLYDHLTQRKGLTTEQAMARITEEFVNYDRLPGRNRGYLENMGMLWFYNYKIRIAKTALSIMRNNPVHALIASAMPVPDGVGTPMMDNVFTKLLEDSLGYSIGPGMALHGQALNPWFNIVD